MTTIVYHDGVLAFDSLASCNGKHFAYITKAIKHDDMLIAGCGEVQCIQAFFDWIKSGGRREDLARFSLDKEPDMNGIVVSGKNIYCYDSKMYPYKVTSKYVAIGSGSDYAMGAVLAGASAVQSVRIAARLDGSTGGRVRSLKL